MRDLAQTGSANDADRRTMPGGFSSDFRQLFYVIVKV